MHCTSKWMGLIHKYIDLLEDMAAAFGRTKCGPWSNLTKLVCLGTCSFGFVASPTGICWLASCLTQGRIACYKIEFYHFCLKCSDLLSTLPSLTAVGLFWSCAMVRKSNAPRGPTKRQKERRTVKEQKARQKNEARFASAVRGSQASLLEQDFQFVTDTLQDNPRWIQPLAGLIRSGALNGILNFTCEWTKLWDCKLIVYWFLQ